MTLSVAKQRRLLRRRRAVALYAKGYTFARIGLLLGCSMGLVRDLLREAGIAPRKRGRPPKGETVQDKCEGGSRG